MPDEAFVQGMFDSIAPRYDFMNRLMAANLDQRWRRLAARAAKGAGTGPFLDVGAGTGDLTRALAREAPGAPVLGLDLARNMLAVGRSKGCAMVQGSGLAIPARDGAFEAITNAFVLRNLADQDAFYREAWRALKPGGRLVSLEINRPPGKIFGPMYRLYFFRVMPRAMRMLSGSKDAYHYLADSVQKIDAPERIAQRMRDAGFSKVEARPMMRGAVVLFVATK